MRTCGYTVADIRKIIGKLDAYTVVLNKRVRRNQIARGEHSVLKRARYARMYLPRYTRTYL